VLAKKYGHAQAPTEVKAGAVGDIAAGASSPDATIPPARIAHALNDCCPPGPHADGIRHLGDTGRERTRCATKPTPFAIFDMMVISDEVVFRHRPLNPLANTPTPPQLFCICARGQVDTLGANRLVSKRAAVETGRIIGILQLPARIVLWRNALALEVVV
jgi:hypothetical protein